MRQLIILLGALLMSACTIQAPHYTPSPGNVSILKKGTKSATLGEFKATKTDTAISLRGTKLNSPYNNSYAEYLKSAITQELEKAQLLSANSSIIIEANILENDLDASGFSLGEGVIQVEFIITNAGQEVYRNTLIEKIEWESSFIGAIAIPNAQLSYPRLIEKLLNALYKDEKFMQIFI